MDHDKTYQEFVAALSDLQRRHGHFTLKLSFSDVLVLIGSLQLALRHPGNTGHSHQVARRIVDDVIRSLEQAAPDSRIGDILRMGDNPCHDV